MHSPQHHQTRLCTMSHLRCTSRIKGLNLRRAATWKFQDTRSKKGNQNTHNWETMKQWNHKSNFNHAGESLLKNNQGLVWKGPTSVHGQCNFKDFLETGCNCMMHPWFLCGGWSSHLIVRSLGSAASCWQSVTPIPATSHRGAWRDRAKQMARDVENWNVAKKPLAGFIGNKMKGCGPH